LVSGLTTDKFAETGLTPVRSDLVDAPYVKECSLVVECKLVHTFELGLHTQFVGEVLDVKADKEVLKAGGLVDVLKVKPLIFTPDTHEYYGVGRFIGRAFSMGESI
jgi:flavin reductase (DIM6/NTAB) family NADH-FMN oxidoreductase RutF